MSLGFHAEIEGDSHDAFEPPLVLKEVGYHCSSISVGATCKVTPSLVSCGTNSMSGLMLVLMFSWFLGDIVVSTESGGAGSTLETDGLPAIGPAPSVRPREDHSPRVDSRFILIREDEESDGQ